MSKPGEINFIDVLYKLSRHWKLILIHFLIITLSAVIISLLLPKWYQAEAVIMPPIKEGGFGFGMSMAGQLAGMMMSGGSDFELPMFATPSDIFEMILKSRGVADSIIHKYHLMQLYKTATIEETRKALTSHTTIEVGKEGAIFLGFEAKADPQLAAQVVTSYIEELDQANQRVKVFYARNTRQFVEQQLEETNIRLAAAEDSLRIFQQRYNTISIQDQVEAAVKNAAELLAMKQLFEVQLGAKQTTLNPTHPEVQELKSKIAAVDAKIRQMKYGDKSKVTQALFQNSEFFPAFTNVPELGLELARRLRNVKIQEAIFELLTQQHEKEKLQEARNTPTVVVLDKAEPPTKKSRPKRAIIVGLAALLSIFYSILVIFLKEYREHLAENRPEDYQKISQIKANFSGILRRNRDHI